MITDKELQIGVDTMLKTYAAGSRSDAMFYLATAVNNNGVNLDLIIEKWGEYINVCKAENRAPQFIRTLDRWLKEQCWTHNYNVQLNESGGNFILRMQNLLKDLNMDL
jgi:hypothetical protein